jgi:CubicO group peptidase (beta-lactamase class C family)
MLLAGGTTGSGRRLLSADAVQLMITNHTTPAQRKIGELFLEGQGWGFGGSVDMAPIDPWNVAGRYGWVGGTGTSAHITPSTGTIAILLTQVATDSPTPAEWMPAFWQYAAAH